MIGAWLLAMVSGPVIAATTIPDARKHYVGHSIEGCEVIDYACPNNWPGFQDEHGCGCLAPPTVNASPAAKKKLARRHKPT